VTRDQLLARVVALTARLGRQEAAKRLGVHPQTITRWKREGLPSLERSPKAKRAAKKVRREKVPPRGPDVIPPSKPPGNWKEESREHITLPPKQRKYEHLTPDQVLPTRDPYADPRVKALLRETPTPAGWTSFDNDAQVGEYAWFDLPAHTDYHSLDIHALREHVGQAYEQSGRVYARFLAIYAYAYADNPAYVGRLAHLKKLAHRWKASVTTNKIASGRDGVRSLVDHAFLREPKRMAPGARRPGYSVDTQAETRVIYVLRYMISTFDRKREGRESDAL